MSRHVHLALPDVTLDEVCAALEELSIAHARGELELPGSLECASEPVAVRITGAQLGAVEEVGIAIEGGRLRLVCGEVDRAIGADLGERVLATVVAARLRGLPGTTVVRSGERLTLRRR
jgi:hypothetical protein